MTKDLVRKVAGAAMKDDFWLFLRYGFGAKAFCKAPGNQRWLSDDVHRPIADWFQERVLAWEAGKIANPDGGAPPTCLLPILPRGFGKSTALTAAGTLWMMLRNPELSIIISSYGQERSAAFLGVIKTVLEGKGTFGWWPQVYGSWEPADGREWKMESIVHSRRKAVEQREPSWEITSINKGATGGRADVFVLDDPISEDKVREDPKHIEQAVRHFRSMRMAVKTDGFWMIPCTRKSDADVVSEAFLTDGVRSFAGTGMIPPRDDYRMGTEDNPGRWDVYFLSVRGADGKSILPSVWTEEALQEIERTDPIRYACELMNMPAQGRQMLVSTEEFDKHWVNPDDVPRNVRISVHCDTAFKSVDRIGKGDDNVIAVVGHSVDGSGVVYCLWAEVSNRWSADEFFNNLVMVFQKVKKDWTLPFILTDEKEPGGKEGLFAQSLASHFHGANMHTPYFEPLQRSATKTKEMRIRYMADYVRSGKVKFVKGGKGLDKLRTQLCRFGIQPHDDVPDAFADAFHDLVYRPEKKGGIPKFSRIEFRRPLDHLVYGKGTPEKSEHNIFAPWFSEE